MDIKKYNASPSFKRVYVVSHEAEKLLKKADRMVKASNAKFMDVNIPEGHKKPLWSVLSEHLTKRQKDNENDIIIDLYEKGKQLISVMIVDAKGEIRNKWIVNPKPVIGKFNEIFPPKDSLTYSAYRKSLDPKEYGKSEFFNIIDTAEVIVNSLQEEFLKSLPAQKTSIKTLPKPAKPKREPEFNAFKPHIWRPFEACAEMFEKLEKLPLHPRKTNPPRIKNIDKLPRKAKKEAKRKAL